MTDECTLLQRYAANRDEAAFAEIARRYLPFVYSAALRRLGRDSHLAADVAQLVFCALARDAGRIARHPVLSGWLYTATRHAALNVIRGEKRRRTREEEACHMQQIESESEVVADWAALRPVLDAALDRLNARDREAVLLRYFQGRSLAEVGAIAGMSEDAARKRIERALARLRDLLRPHGVVSTSTALAALLASQPMAAAPAGLLAKITTAALSTGAATATGITAFIAMTKLQAGVAAAIVAAGIVGLITQQRTISTLREKAAATETRSAKPDLDNAAADQRRDRNGDGSAQPSAGAARPPTAPGEMLAETTSALGHGKVPERYFSFVSILRKLNRDNWREVLQAFHEERKRTGLGHPEVFEIFARHAGEIAGKDVVSHFLAHGWTADAHEAMIGWASKDPAAALRWLGREADAGTRRSVMGAAIRGLALSEPDLAVRTLEEQPVQERNEYATELVTAMLRTVGIDGAQRLVEGMVARAAEARGLKEDYLKHVFSHYSLLRLAQSAASGTVAQTTDWLNAHVGQPYVERRILAEAAAQLARQDPPATLRWLEGVNTTLLQAGDTSTVGYRVVLDTWKATAGAPVVENWMQTQVAHPHYDHIAWQYAALIAEPNPNQALRWADTIKDPKIRQEALRTISQRTPRPKS